MRISQPPRSTRNRPAARSLLSLLAAATIALSLTQLVSAAGPTTSAWQAKVGPSGANGTASVATVSSGAGSIGLKLIKLRASSLLPVAVYKGTCASVGTLLFELPSIKTTSSGAAARTSSLTAAQVNLITSATKGTAKMAIRVASGGSAKCGVFARRSVLGPQAVVQAFYDWYVTDTNWNNLLARPDITPSFVRWLTAFDGAANPIVCAQDYPDTFQAGSAAITGLSATVQVTSALGHPRVTLTLGPKGWLISMIDCGFL